MDVRTQKVLKHSPEAQISDTGKAVLDEGRWDTANERVQDRGVRGDDVFDSALEKEKRREKDLDDLFKKANENVTRRKQSLEDDEL